MARPMTVPEFNRWITKLQNPGRTGWKKAWRKVGKNLAKSHARAARRHMTPKGRPWAPLASKPLPKVGEIATILITGSSGGKVITSKSRGISAKVAYRKLKNVKDKKRATAYRRLFGPTSKLVKALVRRAARGSVMAAKKILNHLRSTRKAAHIRKDFMTFGFRGKDTGWTSRLAGGGRIGKQKVPARPFVGFNRRSLDFATQAIADEYINKVIKA